MRCWAATMSEDRFAGERLYAYDSLTLSETSGYEYGRAGGPRPDDLVALIVAGQPPLLVGLGRVRECLAGSETEPADVVVAYTHRLFDGPVQVGDLLLGDSRPGLNELGANHYASLAGRAGPVPVDTSQWFVSVALPIEAGSRAEAVREFWTHVAKLGPRELPAYVWPQGDELALQAYLLGEETNLDPEEE
jgi:hypothetical protein